MSVCCISNFYEKMDHEFPNTDITLEVKAYKVDGDYGIKKYCKFDDLKSVDYLMDHEVKGFLFVEFSDLWRQNVDIQNQAERIKVSNLCKNDKRVLRKELFKKSIMNSALSLKILLLLLMQ